MIEDGHRRLMEAVVVVAVARLLTTRSVRFFHLTFTLSSNYPQKPTHRFSKAAYFF